MKTYLHRIVMVCLFISLAIAFLSVASIADILAKGIRGNVFILVLDIIILLSETVILIAIYELIFIQSNSSNVDSYKISES
jgi:hypothetical protein